MEIDMSATKICFLGLLLVICNLLLAQRSPSTERAQEPHTTTISGVVLDVNNARIVGTTVKIENEKVSRHLKSDAEGTFQVELPQGEYRITAEHQGFKRFEFSPFHAKAGVCELVNIHMDAEVPRSTLKVN
jgi:hypothetical protein